MQVNYKVLEDEFHFLKAENKELNQYKIHFDDYKRKWDNKVHAIAGDVVETLKKREKEHVEDTEKI